MTATTRRFAGLLRVALEAVERDDFLTAVRAMGLAGRALPPALRFGLIEEVKADTRETRRAIRYARLGARLRVER